MICNRFGVERCGCEVVEPGFCNLDCCDVPINGVSLEVLSHRLGSFEVNLSPQLDLTGTYVIDENTPLEFEPRLACRFQRVIGDVDGYDLGFVYQTYNRIRYVAQCIFVCNEEGRTVVIVGTFRQWSFNAILWFSEEFLSDPVSVTLAEGHSCGNIDVTITTNPPPNSFFGSVTFRVLSIV